MLLLLQHDDDEYSLPYRNSLLHNCMITKFTSLIILNSLNSLITKVKVIKQWITRACAAHKSYTDNPSLFPYFRPYVLALCGSSGCCKSTAVELICKEMDIKIQRWTDDSWDNNTTFISDYNNNHDIDHNERRFLYQSQDSFKTSASQKVNYPFPAIL